jgi:hypothetical protein
MLSLFRDIKPLVIIVSFCLEACSAQASGFLELRPSFKIDTVPIFRKEIPTSDDGNLDTYYGITRQKARQLDLDSLESGFDSLQIRVWYEYELLYQRELIVIKRMKNGWEASHFEMRLVTDDESDPHKIAYSTRRTLNPKGNWNDFINQLISLKVMTLPTMDSIPELSDSWMDGVTYNFEIATKNLYRFYSYHVPEEFQDSFWQAKNVVKILALIKTELK